MLNEIAHSEEAGSESAQDYVEDMKRVEEQAGKATLAIEEKEFEGALEEICPPDVNPQFEAELQVVVARISVTWDEEFTYQLELIYNVVEINDNAFNSANAMEDGSSAGGSRLLPDFYGGGLL